MMLFTVSRLQDEYNAKRRKSCNMCFVDLQKVIDRVPRKVFELAMGNKGIP